jgi:predicted nucleic-acid-binding protein
MLAVDTNVLVRFLARDDADQTARADHLFRRNQIWIPKTVLLETEWVLRNSYSFDRNRIAADFRALLGITTAHAEDQATVADALDWYAAGMDFADALHLASSQTADQFATFDRKLAARAAKLTSAKVLTLR